MSSNIQRFTEIMQEMSELLEESLDLVSGSESRRRAYGYWYGHIKGAIDKEESEFLGGSMVDMAETLGEMQEAGDA